MVTKRRVHVNQATDSHSRLGSYVCCLWAPILLHSVYKDRRQFRLKRVEYFETRRTSHEEVQLREDQRSIILLRFFFMRRLLFFLVHSGEHSSEFNDYFSRLHVVAFVCDFDAVFIFRKLVYVLGFTYCVKK